jgi:hypothetical protein
MFRKNIENMYIQQENNPHFGTKICGLNKGDSTFLALS